MKGFCTKNVTVGYPRVYLLNGNVVRGVQNLPGHRVLIENQPLCYIYLAHGVLQI